MRIAVDTETTGLCRWIGHRPFAVGIMLGERRVRTWSWVVDLKTRRPKPNAADLHSIQKTIDRADEVDFWNGSFDVGMLETVGVAVPWRKVHEVSFMARAVNNLEFSYKLKPLAKKYAGVDDADEKDLQKTTVLARRIAKKLGYDVAEDIEQDYWMPAAIAVHHPKEALAAGLDGSACSKYLEIDCLRTYLLGGMYREAMRELGVRHIYDFEMSLLPETVEMERVGVRVISRRLKEKRAECESIIAETQAELSSKLGSVSEHDEFNINSPRHVGRLLFGPNSVAKIACVKRTKTGQPKTDADALAQHKSHPVVQNVLRLRANNHAMKTFFRSYEKYATVEDGDMILHPGYNQWGTLTGRYTCSNPNLLAVSDPDTSNSINKEFMVDIRYVFAPRRGRVWYCFDHSQVEVVIFADVSGEPTMVRAILDGHDIHGATAEKIWGGRDNPKAVAEAMVLLGRSDVGLAKAKLDEFGWRIGELEQSLGQKSVRKKSKSVTFTKIFGGGPNALMHWIGVGRSEAVRILADYDDAFPTLVSRTKEIELRARKDGYVTNIYGRRLSVDPWKPYVAVNHIVQSSAADLMKRGLLKSARYLREVGVDARVAMTIHDEIVFEFNRRHCFAPVLRRIKQLMSDHEGKMSIPVRIDIDKVTESWSEKTKVEGI